ncbi:MAG: family 10 glycosylhydrolase [Planctomycetota bacterium]
MVALLVVGCAVPPRPAPVGLERAVWVTRWDWRTEADIRNAVGRCADLGFRAVFFQVRGNGTALYRSQHEVWSDAFRFENPGFDPLEVAAEAAMKSGVQLHAWINLMPGWSGDQEPDDPRQLWHARGEWFLRDASGQREPLGKGAYAGLNPCLPEVRDYLAGLCVEVARVPGVAGVHLDYVRLTSGDEPGGIDRYPADELTRTRFRIDKGQDPTLAPEAFRAWKVECVSKLVEQVRTLLRGTPALLSVAVLADPVRALASGQDWRTWASRGFVDAIVPMAYAADDAQFKRFVQQGRAAAGRCALIVGVGLYKHEDPLQTVRQMQIARSGGASGVALFSYGELVKPEREDFTHELRRWLHSSQL